MRLTRPALALGLLATALLVLAECDKGPTRQELQRQVTELETKLKECQGNPMKDALEAFQTFNSTVGTGVNEEAYKTALIPLKVKVDKLPDNEHTTQMKKTVDMLIDGGNLWNISIAKSTYDRGRFVWIVEVQPYIDKYKDEWNEVNTKACREDGKEFAGASCIKSLGMRLISRGQENIKGFPKP